MHCIAGAWMNKSLISIIRADPESIEPGEIVLNLVNKGSVKLGDKFTVISRANIRQRPLPQR